MSPNTTPIEAYASLREAFLEPVGCAWELFMDARRRRWPLFLTSGYSAVTTARHSAGSDARVKGAGGFTGLVGLGAGGGCSIRFHGALPIQ
jgi:hypothetical protein